jgi:Zn finger protein HypA/HybF involved in hydrogenase expression
MARKNSWTTEQLTEAVKTSISYLDVLRKLDLRLLSGNAKHIKHKIQELGLNTSHFRGVAHGKGTVEIPLEKVLVEKSTYGSTSRLKKRLIKKGLLQNKCSECGGDPVWRAKPLVLVLDHINGVNNDNRIENLRLVCPNCNSQLATFCRGNRIKKQAKKCKICNAYLSQHNSTGLCMKCYNPLPRPYKRKVERPSKEELERMLLSINIVAIGRKYNVSETAIRKWMGWYSIVYKGFSYDREGRKIINT